MSLMIWMATNQVAILFQVPRDPLNTSKTVFILIQMSFVIWEASPKSKPILLFLFLLDWADISILPCALEEFDGTISYVFTCT